MAPHLSAPHLPRTGPAGEPGPTHSHKVCLITCRGFGRMGNQTCSPPPTAQILPSIGKKFLRKKVITELFLKNERVFSGRCKSCRNHRKIQGDKISGAHIPESAQSRLCRSRSRRPRPRPPRQGTGPGGSGRGASPHRCVRTSHWAIHHSPAMLGSRRPLGPQIKVKRVVTTQGSDQGTANPSDGSGPPKPRGNSPPISPGWTDRPVFHQRLRNRCRAAGAFNEWVLGCRNRPTWPRTGRKAAP